MDEDVVFDMVQLMNSTCDDEVMAAQVIEIFRVEIPDQLRQLQQALDSDDRETAQRMAHSIKGSSAAIGGMRLRSLAEAGEALGRDGELARLRAMLPELRRQFELLDIALKAAGL